MYISCCYNLFFYKVRMLAGPDEISLERGEDHHPPLHPHGVGTHQVLGYILNILK